MRRVAMLLAVVVLAGPAFAGTELYVSTAGDDGWTGKPAEPNAAKTDGPFATLERARDEIRKMHAEGRTSGAITVQVRGGDYLRDKAFALEAGDSGMAEAPIVYRAYRSEKVRLLGGRIVHGWRPVEAGPAADRIDAACRDKIVQVDLKALGVIDNGSLSRRGFFGGMAPASLELVFDDKNMTLARWPNEGFTKVGDVLGEEPVTLHGFKGDKVGKLVYDGDRAARWAAEPDAWLHGYWFWDWADGYEKVESIDPVKKLITLAKPYHGYGYRKGARYYAVNLLCELDSPGEWYLDRGTGVLYFWPPKPVDSAEAYVTTATGLAEMKGVSNVTLRGVILDGCRGTAVTITSGQSVTIDGCTIRHTGNNAVVATGGDIAIVNGRIYDLGDGGITISGGDRKTLTESGDRVENNEIFDYSRTVFTYRSAVAVNGVGVRVANNLIHDAPHNAIGLGGNEHKIEFNEIHHVCMETDDAGAFYMGRDWTQRGNVVRYNYFHHIGVYKSWVGTQSVYLDDWSSGTTVFGNIIYKGGRGVLVGGGRDNTVENNVFIDCTPAVHVDSRGLGWAKNYFDGKDNTLVTRLNDMPYKTPPWSERYPQLLTLYEDEPALAKGNAVVRNICVEGKGKWLDLHDKLTDKIVRVEDNLVDVDPLFVDREKENFQLRPESPAFKLGFQRIPIERIGLKRAGAKVALKP